MRASAWHQYTQGFPTDALPHIRKSAGTRLCRYPLAMDPSNPIPPRANGGARSPDSALTPLYGRIGALPFATFSERLYARIDSDARIRAMFPADLSPTSESVRDMREFLTQFFGGAQTYSMRKGHPDCAPAIFGFPLIKLPETHGLRMRSLHFATRRSSTILIKTPVNGSTPTWSRCRSS